jgi:hypothetical protein
VSVHGLPAPTAARRALVARLEKPTPPLKISFNFRQKISPVETARMWFRFYMDIKERAKMKKHAKKLDTQPEPFTPGITRAQVRQHAFEMFRDKLGEESLTLDDWVMAEKDLVQTMDSDGLLKR